MKRFPSWDCRWEMITHFCGVPVPEILGDKGKICCKTAIGDSVVLTLMRDGRTLELRSSMPSSNALQPTRESSSRNLRSHSSFPRLVPIEQAIDESAQSRVSMATIGIVEV